MRRLLQLTFRAGGPPAAITVLRNPPRRCSELLLTAAHAITDGLSAIMLVHDLSTEYARAEANCGEKPPAVLPRVTAERARAGACEGDIRRVRTPGQ